METKDEKKKFGEGPFDLIAVLNWVLDEQLAGRRPNDFDVAKHFGIALEDAIEIHDRLEAAGEFD